MRICEFSLLAGPRAPGAIREAVDMLPGISPAMRSDARLIAAALCTAPLLVPGDCGPVVLQVRVSRRLGSIRVHLEATSQKAPPAAATDDRLRRHALPLLERVCSRWGMARSGAVGSVWFELEERDEPEVVRLPGVAAFASGGVPG